MSMSAALSPTVLPPGKPTFTSSLPLSRSVTASGTPPGIPVAGRPGWLTPRAELDAARCTTLSAFPILPGALPGPCEAMHLPDEQPPRSCRAEDCDGNSEPSNLEDEPAPLKILDCWSASKTKINVQRAKSLCRQVSYCSSELSVTDGEQALLMFKASIDAKQWYILHPQSRMRLSWDCMGLFLVSYDMVTVPLFAFDLSDTHLFLAAMGWFSRLFWTLDIGLSLVTGVVLQDGSVNLDFWYILARYIKSWFALDALIVSLDWVEAATVLAGNDGKGLGTVARIIRISRALRLLRLVRMQTVLQTLVERLQSDNMILMVSILKLITFVTCVSHAVACIWFAIGEGESADTSWVSSAGYDTADVPDQYLASLHWALSQYNGGLEDIAPVTAAERLFAIFVWMFSFFATGIIVSILTSNLTRMYMVRGKETEQMSSLRRFMLQNGVSGKLTSRILRNAQYATAAELMEDGVELLQDVSQSLKVDMHFEMYAALLRENRFFANVETDSLMVSRSLCHEAMRTIFFAKNDIVFSRGEEPRTPRMYIVWFGSLEYEDPTGELISAGGRDVIAEASLWTAWIHRGRLMSKSETKMAALDATRLQEVMFRYRSVHGLYPQLYAADFVEFANSTLNMHDLTCMPPMPK